MAGESTRSAREAPRAPAPRVSHIGGLRRAGARGGRVRPARWSAARFAPTVSCVRIALVSTPFVAVPPPAYGGTELVVHALARALARRGHDVTVFATGDSHVPRLRAMFPLAGVAARPVRRAPPLPLRGARDRGRRLRRRARARPRDARLRRRARGAARVHGAPRAPTRRSRATTAPRRAPTSVAISARQAALAHPVAPRRGPPRARSRDVPLLRPGRRRGASSSGASRG